MKCTINDSFMGVPLGDCGAAADTVAEYQCPAGHTETAVMCPEHRAQLLPEGQVCCATCVEDSGDRWVVAQLVGSRWVDPRHIPGQLELPVGGAA